MGAGTKNQKTIFIYWWVYKGGRGVKQRVWGREGQKKGGYPEHVDKNFYLFFLLS